MLSLNKKCLALFLILLIHDYCEGEEDIVMTKEKNRNQIEEKFDKVNKAEKNIELGK